VLQQFCLDDLSGFGFETAVSFLCSIFFSRGRDVLLYKSACFNHDCISVEVAKRILKPLKSQ